ncbi:hypothetical protein [Epibacterium ulvae]|uniref:hypothetical protein n=1 Tax=Epibacterium ulvae TaxID=1156985 RepID=UPI0024917AC3|nr:hypothetical protein [Epibacterium ulvae]
MERAYAESGVQTIVLRARNFIDPNRQACVMSAIYLCNIQRGKLTLPGLAETRQAMCYLSDWSRAAVALAQKRKGLSQFEDVPLAGHTLTTLTIKSEIERIQEREVKCVQFPWWVFKVSAPVCELARELSEIRYLWSTDHAFSDTRLI